jgi:hypothetical protein
MKEELKTGYQRYKEDGLSQMCRMGTRELNRQWYNLTSGTQYNKSGVDIHEEEWDNLIILDACRFDYFKRYCTLDGTLESRISRGSTSSEFIRGNFTDRIAYDTVYLSDNPWYGRLHREIDSELYHFSFCERDAFDGTVTHPETVTDSALDYYEQHPNKRFIVHYMQPHAPYFTADGEERFSWPGKEEYDPTPEEVQEAYVGNLKLVLDEIPRLIDAMEGRTVVTADHGELLGERLPPLPMLQYQHSAGLYVDPLVKVPWLIIDDESEKDIVTADAPMKYNYPDDFEQRIDSQLKDLGYLE